METEVKAYKLELFRLSWFMRGGLPMNLVYETDAQDREILTKLIESNLDTTSKSKLPFF